MTESWFQLFNLVAVIVAFGVAVGATWIGYWMGRNSIDMPLRSENNPKLTNQGSTDDPGGDPFEEAMEDRTLNDPEERINTMPK